MRILDTVLDLLVPDACVLCEQTQRKRNPHLLCPYCWAALPRNIACCRHCAIPLAKAGICATCQANPLTPGHCIAPLLHEDEARVLVHQLKYANGLRAGQTLAMAMVDAARLRYAGGPWPHALVPVPLSYRNQVRRGYNQAAWLAHCIGRTMSLPVYYGPIKRRHGPAQHTLSKGARLGMSTRTFRLQKSLPHTHVAIVDDVLTTGGTTTALASMLMQHGAGRVDIWCATRA